VSKEAPLFFSLKIKCWFTPYHYTTRPNFNFIPMGLCHA